MLQACVAFIRLVNTALGLLAGICFFAAGAIMFFEVVCRYSGNPTSWVNETSVYLFGAAMLLGSPYALMRRRHVRVELLISRLSPALRRAALRLSALGGAAFSLLVLRLALLDFLEVLETGETTTTTLHVPLWIIELPLVLSFAMLAVEFLLQAWQGDEQEAATAHNEGGR